MSLEVKELQIPIPYGYIAAKAWGSDQGLPVLALHGYLDNAGTFDNLVPLLSPSLYIVAIDCVGHGLSSHKPHGIFYNYIEVAFDIERVVQYLKWEQFSIIGHSLGGTVALMYASVFPDKVLNVVLLDIWKPSSLPAENLPESTRDVFDKLFYLERRMDGPVPVYSSEDAKARLMQALHGELKESSAAILIRRGIKQSPCGTGVVFRRDIRLKTPGGFQRLSHDDLKAYMRRLNCNLLIIVGKHSGLKNKAPEILNNILDIYREVCNSFQIVEVDGNHFVHLNEPWQVAPHINSFFGFHSSNPKVSKL